MKKILSRKFALFVACALALAVVFSLCGCSGGNEQIKVKNSVYYEYFDTVCIVYDYTGGSDEKFSEALEIVESELAICHKLFDIYEEYAGIINIKSINDRAGEGAVKVDARIIDMLSFSKEMYRLTDGNVNVAMGSVLSIWHEYREKGNAYPESAAVPDMASLQSAVLCFLNLLLG